MSVYRVPAFAASVRNATDTDFLPDTNSVRTKAKLTAERRSGHTARDMALGMHGIGYAWRRMRRGCGDGDGIGKRGGVECLLAPRRPRDRAPRELPRAHRLAVHIRLLSGWIDRPACSPPAGRTVYRQSAGAGRTQRPVRHGLPPGGGRAHHARDDKGHRTARRPRRTH